MKLLEEKKYITEIRRFEVEDLYQGDEVGSTFAIDYKCKYWEVMDRIIDEICNWHDNSYLLNITYQRKDFGNNRFLKKDEIKIIFTDKLENQIYELMGDKEECRIQHNEIGYIQLSNISFTEFYEIKYNRTHDCYDVVDLFKRKVREDDEKKEYEECLEFLRQLP